MYQWKQEWIFYRTGIVPMSSIVAMLFAVRDDSGRRLLAVRSDRTDWERAQLSQNVMRCFSFHFLLRYSFYESSGRKYFRFPQVLIKILSSKFNIFHYSFLLHYYYARSNSRFYGSQCILLDTVPLVLVIAYAGMSQYSLILARLV